MVINGKTSVVALGIAEEYRTILGSAISKSMYLLQQKKRRLWFPGTIYQPVSAWKFFLPCHTEIFLTASCDQCIHKKRFRINWSWSLFSKGRLSQMLKRKTGAQVWNSSLIFKKYLSFCGSLCAKSVFGLIQNVYLFCQDWIDSAIHFNMQQGIFTARNKVAAR